MSSAEKELANGDVLRRVTYWCGGQSKTRTYMAYSIDGILPEHRTTIALLDVLPATNNTNAISTTTKILSEDGKKEVACKNIWAGVNNYWIFNHDI